MGRNKDQKALRRNAPGIARNRALGAAANNDDDAGNEEDAGPHPDIDCPKCGVIAGYPCETPSGRIVSKTHVARLK